MSTKSFYGSLAEQISKPTKFLCVCKVDVRHVHKHFFQLNILNNLSKK